MVHRSGSGCPMKENGKLEKAKVRIQSCFRSITPRTAQQTRSPTGFRFSIIILMNSFLGDRFHRQKKLLLSHSLYCILLDERSQGAFEGGREREREETRINKVKSLAFPLTRAASQTTWIMNSSSIKS